MQKMYPQGEDKDATWSMTVIMYHVALLGGVVAALISAFWMLHIVLYMMPDPPVSSFLNEFFIAMDEAWGLFGTTAFATFCFYFIMCVIKWNVKIGFRLLLFSVYPMKIGGTLMSSLLLNVKLIMLSSIAVIQFLRAGVRRVRDRHRGLEHLRRGDSELEGSRRAVRG